MWTLLRTAVDYIVYMHQMNSQKEINQKTYAGREQQKRQLLRHTCQ